MSAKPPRVHHLSLVAGLLLGVAAAVVGAAVATRPGAPDSAPTPAPAPVDAAATAPALPSSADPQRRTEVVQAVERVAPAVVSITTEVPVNDPFARFRGAPQSTTSEGSGVVIEADGLVLTNAHVVARASRIQASFADGRSYEADILGLAEELDLAVLRLRDARDLVAVEVGSSADLMLGEPVIAIGNPFGLGHTVTTGVISATRRPLPTDERVYQDFLQTDASINPGNSGGPLLDVHGRLIGINTAIRPDAQGIGFAIPVDRAMKVAADLSRYGRVQIPWLGVDLEDVYIQDAGGAGRAAGSRTAARVVRVHEGAGAAGAGLQPGDVIVAVQGRAVQGRGDLNAWLAGFPPGRAVELSLRRPTRESWRELTLSLAASALPDEVVDESLSQVLGIEVAEGSHKGGVPVTAVSATGAFAQVGGRPGDNIMSLNGQPVSSAAELRAAVAAAKSGHRGDALLTVRRGGAWSRIKLPL
ncbi:trypsin-like peptidase domain-containing protein [Myxococcota bacterium]|nr:trypsin-like peptidase domain-containing protein [Myxococcota bacterium]